MDYITKNKKLLGIIENLKEISNSDTNILLTGESGTGKTFLAKEIYKKSQVKNKNLIIVNCASIPENLFESELFGYKKGAFTDAKGDREGLIEAANNGTIVFDEIGDMPMSMQAKLLDLIQEKKFRRVGDNKYKEANVRIISATNKDLLEEIRVKKFREDLFYRISILSFNIIPLRERKEDIPLLIDFFISKYSTKYNKSIEGIDRNTLDSLIEYSWPGNVRELEGVIEKAVLLEKRGILTNFNLPIHLKKISSNIYFNETIKHSFVNQFLISENEEEFPTLSDIENEYIKKIYSLVKGNKLKTSKILDIDRKTLYKKLKDLKIE